MTEEQERFSQIESAQRGDKIALDYFVQDNAPLVWSIVSRYAGRGVESEDLFQLGNIGLIKAIYGFDTEYGTQFSTYAVPKISGEIRRFLRDDGMLKVSRTLKEIAIKAYGIREKMEKSRGREPTAVEIAEELHCARSRRQDLRQNHHW